MNAPDERSVHEEQDVLSLFRRLSCVDRSAFVEVLRRVVSDPEVIEKVVRDRGGPTLKFVWVDAGGWYA